MKQLSTLDALDLEAAQRGVKAYIESYPTDTWKIIDPVRLIDAWKARDSKMSRLYNGMSGHTRALLREYVITLQNGGE